MSSPSQFAPVTDDVLARARQDPAFRKQLLTQSLDLLLNKLQRLRAAPRSAAGSPAQMREGAVLAVKLAELIQAAGVSPRTF
jgi:hypothetical protein